MQVQVGQQGGAQSAGELPELTKLEEEEEAAAKAEPKAGGDGEAAKVSAAAAQPKPKVLLTLPGALWPPP